MRETVQMCEVQQNLIKRQKSKNPFPYAKKHNQTNEPACSLVSKSYRFDNLSYSNLKKKSTLNNKILITKRKSKTPYRKTDKAKQRRERSKP